MLDRLLDLLTGCWHLLRFAVIVDAYQRAIVLRLGKFHRELDPGFHWVWPLGVECAIAHTVVSSVHSLSPQSVTTADGHSCVVQAIVTWRVRDVRALLLDIEDADHALLDASHGIIATHIAGATWADVSTAGFLDNAAKEIRKRAFRWGVEVQQVQFSDLQRCKSLRLWQEHR